MCHLWGDERVFLTRSPVADAGGQISAVPLMVCPP